MEKIVSSFTILGAQGYIGNELSTFLRSKGHTVHCPKRNLSLNSLLESISGEVIYCIGLTADFRTRPWDTIDAHVSLLRHILKCGKFSSLTYLSSTRVYLNAKDGFEHSNLIVNPEVPDQLYNLSKLTGEAMCSAADRHDRPVRVVRISNVIGCDISSENFIYSIIRDALKCKLVKLNTSPHSSKDYVSITDVVALLELISTRGKHRTYNVASGINITHSEIIKVLSTIPNAKFEFDSNAPTVIFPNIDVSRIIEEFSYTPTHPFEMLNGVLSQINNLNKGKK